jgi:phage FluMu gp28-like protein
MKVKVARVPVLSRRDAPAGKESVKKLGLTNRDGVVTLDGQAFRADPKKLKTIVSGKPLRGETLIFSGTTNGRPIKFEFIELIQESRSHKLLSKISESMSKEDVLSDIIDDVRKKISPEKEWEKFKKEVLKQAKKQNIKTDGYEIADLLGDN